MTINKVGLDLIKEYEGLRLDAYPDPGSKDGVPWTIGYGHAVGVAKGDKITAAKAEEFLLEDLKQTFGVIGEYVKPELNENQYAALVSFVFNIGETLFKKSSVLKYINEDKLDSVPGRMALYRLNDGKVMAGLVRRRTAEGALWMQTVNVHAAPPDQGSNTPAKPDTPKKPWDWGATTAFITLLAGLSDQAKKLIGNVTTAFGVAPWMLLVALGVSALGFTLYNKWKDK